MLEALLFSFFLEVGYIPYDATVTPVDWTQVDSVFYTDLDATLRFHFLFVGGGMKAFVWPYGSDSIGLPAFWPYRMDYRFNAGLVVGPITVGLRHLCSHPVMPYVTWNRVTTPKDGAYTELFLRIEGGRK